MRALKDHSILILFFFSISCIHAQRKSIVISEDLVANSEEFKVKMGTQWYGKIWKFKFGDYAVKESKLGWTVISERANLLDTQTESKTDNKFSFVLGSKTSDSAIVNALSNVLIKELHAFKLFSTKHVDFYTGEDELLIDANTFSSFITTSSDPDDLWVLTLEQTIGSNTDYKHEGLLSNGDRVINIIPVSSNKYGNDRRMFPALGYEFLENDESLCAVQYFGGGAFGANKNMVWLKTSLDPRMKLILAASMTALMQLRTDYE